MGMYFYLYKNTCRFGAFVNSCDVYKSNVICGNVVLFFVDKGPFFIKDKIT